MTNQKHSHVSVPYIGLRMLLSAAGWMIPIATLGAVPTIHADANFATNQQPTGQKTEGDRLVTPSLIFETRTLQPGTVVNMGISYAIEPKWHIYWNGQNDSGFAPEIELQLPQGFEALPTQWPAPMRHVAEGDITDHIYEGRVTLIAPIRVPRDVKDGTEVTFGLQSKWLVCFDRCIPGSGTASVKMKVQAGAPEKSKESELIQASLKAMPVAFDSAKHELEVDVKDDVLAIKPKAGAGTGLESIAFFPAENGRSLMDIAQEGISTRKGAQGPALKAKLSKLAAPKDGTSSPGVVGIIEVKTKETVKWYWFDQLASVQK